MPTTLESSGQQPSIFQHWEQPNPPAVWIIEKHQRWPSSMPKFELFTCGHSITVEISHETFSTWRIICVQFISNTWSLIKTTTPFKRKYFSRFLVKKSYNTLGTDWKSINKRLFLLWWKLMWKNCFLHWHFVLLTIGFKLNNNRITKINPPVKISK